jgi:hypothetical protein
MAGVLHLERPITGKGPETRIDNERIQSSGNSFLIVEGKEAVLKSRVDDPGSIRDTRTPDRENRTDERSSNQSDRKSPE